MACLLLKEDTMSTSVLWLSASAHVVSVKYYISVMPQSSVYPHALAHLATSLQCLVISNFSKLSQYYAHPPSTFNMWLHVGLFSVFFKILI